MHSFAFSDEPLNYTPVHAHCRPTTWTSLLLVPCLGKSDDVSCVIILSSTSSPLVTLTLGTLLFTLRAILTWIHTFLQLYPFSGQSLLRITWCFFVTSSEWLVSSILRFPHNTEASSNQLLVACLDVPSHSPGAAGSANWASRQTAWPCCTLRHQQRLS